MASGSKYVMAVEEDEVSAYAFTWALKNLFKAGDEVVLITASFADASLPSADITSGEIVMPLTTSAIVEESKELTARATAVLEKYLKLCGENQIKSEGKVVEGTPGAHVVAEADKAGADAIVVGSHGRNIIGRTLLGSISDYVRHNSSLPVVVVKFPKEGERDTLGVGPSRKIVAAVDESAESARALAWATQHFVKDEDTLVLLHVQNPVAQPTALGTDQLGMEDVYVPPDTTGKATVKALGESEKLVEVFMKQAAESTKAKCEGRVVSGGTGDKILQELLAVEADVVVVGSHDKGVIQRTILGSVSDFLAHNSPCPMVFVKLARAGGEGADHAHAG